MAGKKKSHHGEDHLVICHVTVIVTVQVLLNDGINERIHLQTSLPDVVVAGSVRKQMSDPRDHA